VAEGYAPAVELPEPGAADVTIAHYPNAVHGT